MTKRAYAPGKPERNVIAGGIWAPDACAANWRPKREPVGNRQKRRNPAGNATLDASRRLFRPTDFAEEAKKNAWPALTDVWVPHDARDAAIFAERDRKLAEARDRRKTQRAAARKTA